MDSGEALHMNEITKESRTTELVADGLQRVTEAASFLGISRSHVYQLMDSGVLPYVKLGRSRRVPRRAVLQLAASRLVNG
jgi:excisionase family DNA binding protein